MDTNTSELEVGQVYDLRVSAKSPQGEGMGRVNNLVVFVKNTKTRIGKVYKVRITDMHEDFAYGESTTENSKYFIGNGSLII
jgi:predicted RNA-binding protein with TRAM domain